MFDVTTKTMEWAGRTLTIETGRMARQADGAVKISYDGTTVLATAVGAKKMRPDQDFFPLSVHYQEKTYAAGKIPGGFFKREGRPSEKETLTSRLIDRPIRPLFPKAFKNEVQVVTTVITHDLENDPDIVAMVGASAALTISGMPFFGPIAGARVGMIDGEFILNPTQQEMEDSELDLVVAGTKEGVLMVESQANELNEEKMLEAVMFGWNGFQPVIDMIIDLAEDAAKDPWDLPEEHPRLKEVKEKTEKMIADDLRAAYEIKDKQERSNALSEARSKVTELYAEDEEVSDALVADCIKSLESDIVRGDLIKTGNRIDGRDTKTVRPIVAEVDVLPRTHGSALFTRGETQALVVATLGTGDDEQLIDALEGEYKERFLLHYNFPPFSVGECGRMGGAGRREIGHGKLAWRAISPMLPSAEDFPYTIRVVSEILESNGSSSMATVCGTSMALMNAGVPMEKAVSGIAMGLIKEDDDFVVLSDILGDEDHLGDMDFKVAGTKDGITSLQMDIKITSITEEIMKVALTQAKDGRLHILGEMAKGIEGSRDGVSEYAPMMESMTIPTDKIRDVIGSGGKVIREIIDTTGAKIDIEDDGSVRVSGMSGESVKAAMQWIKDLTDEPEVGTVYEGKVVKIMDFGAFVNFLGKNDGLVHISEIVDERVEKVTDHLNEGDEVKVLLMDVDNRGKYKLSMRLVDQETGEVLEDERSNKREKKESA